MTENPTVWKSDNQGVKEETFIQTGRRGGDGQLGGKNLWQGGSWRTRQGGSWQSGWSHICMRINREEQLGSETDLSTQDGEIDAKRLLETPVGGEEAAGETPSLTGEFAGETHRGLERTQTHPPGNKHQKGPIYLSAEGEVTENQPRVDQVALFPQTPSPHIVPQCSDVGCPALANT